VTPETRLKHQIKDCLKLHGWFVLPILQGMGAYRGISDLIAIRKGQVVFIELKSKRGQLSKHQEKFRDDVSLHGGTYIVVRAIEDLQPLGVQVTTPHG
jgi:Holliday junction resolvase